MIPTKPHRKHEVIRFPFDWMCLADINGKETPLLYEVIDMTWRDREGKEYFVTRREVIEYI